MKRAAAFLFLAIPAASSAGGAPPTEAAIAELARLYRKTHVGFPQGSADERGNYVHLLVIWLEYRADRQLPGELRARQVMEFRATDHYTWIFRTVLDHRDRIGRIVSRHKLLP